MTRRAMTLIEVAISVAIFTLILDIGVNVLREMLSFVRSGSQSSQIIDLTCDALRRDLEHGARIDGKDLVVARWPADEGHSLANTHSQEVRWHLDGDTLLRGEVPRCHVTHAAWSSTPNHIVVRFQPIGLPPREISTCR